MMLTAWAALAAICVYGWTGFKAGAARAKYNVLAPSMDGPLAFQSAQRVQMNTLEQLPLLLVPLWVCASYTGDRWAAAGGALWCVGRVVYALAYYKDPASRSLGFGIGFTACIYLFVAAAAGLLMH